MTVPEPQGARARQTYYWQVRNARTRALQRVNACETWHIEAGHPGGAYCDLGHGPIPPEHHTPTLLTRRTYGRHDDQYRGGCLSCDWEGPAHASNVYGEAENRAVDDAHDHAFPGWRDLPTITKVKDSWDLPRNRRLWQQITTLYPSGWVDHGAPLLVWARYRDEPHDPPYRGRPRYELRVDKPPQQTAPRTTDQEALF